MKFEAAKEVLMESSISESEKNGPKTRKEPAEKETQSWKSASPLTLTLLAFVLAAVSDLLFHWHEPGISIPIFALLCVVLFFVSGRLENRPILKQDVVLALLILFFSGLSVVRLEPMTRTLSIMSMLALLALWVWSYGNAEFFKNGILDFFLAWMAPAIYWIYPWGILGQGWKKLRGDRESRSVVRSVVVGIILALPIVVLFTVLFSAADLVFQSRIEELADWLQLEALKDVFTHSIWILVFFIFLLGALVMALQKGVKRKPINDGKQLVPPFLGSIETKVILVSVSLLFAVFVGFQFAYLFGGEANITAAGFTYAEYARRGFFELVAVAILTLLLMLGMRSFSKGETNGKNVAFKVLCSMLITLVLVILGSALKRMLLYEDAYGLTRLRTYTLAGLGWITVLFGSFSLLLWSNLQVRFAQVLAAVALGFTATLGFLNVDAFIARRNLNRYLEGEKLDTWHMMTLTDDAVPVIVNYTEDHPDDVDDELLAGLVCRNLKRDQEQFQDWQAYHFSRASAESATAEVEDLLSKFTVIEDEEWYSWSIEWPSGQIVCDPWGW